MNIEIGVCNNQKVYIINIKRQDQQEKVLSLFKNWIDDVLFIETNKFQLSIDEKVYNIEDEMSFVVFPNKSIAYIDNNNIDYFIINKLDIFVSKLFDDIKINAIKKWYKPLKGLFVIGLLFWMYFLINVIPVGITSILYIELFIFVIINQMKNDRSDSELQNIFKIVYNDLHF